ncbi:hydrogenase expression/formation protein HypE [Vallitalea guaymasensis]|uniref:hydrogenase expression/formation protein HypE n=1 Tax=Vallitalea guaymasensis TaxID=1185412 RepID=UPI001FA8E2AD|nr:hydrogenase expression/formation protein HypE [Vallitalea guaymasensis]
MVFIIDIEKRDNLCKTIQLRHGDGGIHTSKLINDIFYRYFGNPILLKGRDSAIFEMSKGRLAYSTDSFVVKPIFFEGGNIGKLAACGTINDLTVSGAKPLYLSAGFIIEEGFDIEQLERIVSSMQEVCSKTNTLVVTGDTKVVDRGSVDGIFINTSGIGSIYDNYNPDPIGIGDEIIITGGIGEHGTAIAIRRYDLNIQGNIKSDCDSLTNILVGIKKFLPHVKMMKDPTRGGMATSLNEIAEEQGIEILLEEDSIPIADEVKGVTEILGLDPYYLACEGRMILIAEKGYGEKIVKTINELENGKDAGLIGRVVDKSKGIVCLRTTIGGKRRLYALSNSMLPRIC